MSPPKSTRFENEVHSGVPHKVLDLKFGYALLMDRRVPVYSKITAIGIGIAGIAILGFLELPVEEIIAAIPVLGTVWHFPNRSPVLCRLRSRSSSSPGIGRFRYGIAC